MKNKDSIRMDWLETVSGQFYGVGYPEGDVCVLHWDTDGNKEHKVEAKTLRAAIDKAMKQHSS